MSDRTWSAQQDAIFGWFERGSGHLVVRARAGCGKTTTIVEGVNRAPERSILLCAFNKRIAEELTARVTNPAGRVQTLHSVGFAAVTRYWEGIRVCKNNERALTLTERVSGPRVPDAIKKLVTKLHTKGREIVPHALLASDLVDLAYAFECEPDEDWQAEGWTVERVCEGAVRAMKLAASEKPLATGIDFADMIFLPVRNRWLTPRYDLVVVDEAQDMTVAQLEIARGVARGRICVVGDDRQAIYGFRGADAGSLDRLKGELEAAELGLTTTYRCGRTIVAEAATIVPDFAAGATNPEGSILGLAPSKLTDAAQLGDFVLSRANAPLVATAMSLLRAGKRTRVAGRDIGAGLRALVRKISKSARSVPEFLERLAGWEEREITRAIKAKREEKVEAIQDQADMLRNLADDAHNLAEIEGRKRGSSPTTGSARPG